METYALTIWLLWPKVAGKQAAEIIRHITNSLESCQALADYYATVIAADGVESWLWQCASQWPT